MRCCVVKISLVDFFGAVWSGVFWFVVIGLALCGVVWRGVPWCGLSWCGLLRGFKCSAALCFLDSLGVIRQGVGSVV